MLDDTSKARITVPCRRGRSIFASGRARPDEQDDDADEEDHAARRAGATRGVDRCASRLRHGAELALVGGPPPDDPDVADDEHRNREQEQQARRARWKVTGGPVASACRPCARGPARCRRRSRRRRGRHRRVGSPSAAARRVRRPPLRSGDGTPDRRCRRSSCSPVSASCSTTTPGVDQPDLARGPRSAPRPPRGAARACPSARSHPGSLMKSESTNTSERRRMVVRPGPEEPAQIGGRTRAGAVARSRSRVRRSTWRRPLRGSTMRSIALS